MTLLVHDGYSLSTRTGVVLGPDGRPVGRVRHGSHGRAWCWRAHDDTHDTAPTRAAALAALVAHLDKEETQ